MTTADPAALRVVIADDHPMYRRALAAVVTDAGWEVVAEAGDGAEAVAATQSRRPDVVVMDLNMPVTGGIDATARISSTWPEVAVLVLTMLEDDDSLFSAMRAGARGYLLKDADDADIVRAIAAVADGDAIFGPGVARRVLQFFAVQRPAAVAPFAELTPRETEVLDLVAAGRSNSDIAATLRLSPKTVRNHLSNIFAKLRVADRNEAIVRARDAGLGR